MTAIQSFRTPANHVTSNVMSKVVLTALAITFTIANIALLVIALGMAASAVSFSAWTGYFLVLGVYIAAVAATGAHVNAREARKTQFDIR
jgi:predicted membrane protein